MTVSLHDLSQLVLWMVLWAGAVITFILQMKQARHREVEETTSNWQRLFDMLSQQHSLCARQTALEPLRVFVSVGVHVCVCGWVGQRITSGAIP